MSVVTCFDLLS